MLIDISQFCSFGLTFTVAYNSSNEFVFTATGGNFQLLGSSGSTPNILPIMGFSTDTSSGASFTGTANPSVASMTSSWNVQITPGSYNNSELVTAIQNALNNSGTALVFTVTYNSTTLLLTISATGSFSLNFTGSNTLYLVMGFLQQIYSSTGNSITAPNAFIVSYPLNILIRISELGNGYIRSNTINMATYIIPITSNSGDYIIWEKNSHFKQFVDIEHKAIAQLSISLWDTNNVPISLNNSEWSMILSTPNYI